MRKVRTNPKQTVRRFLRENKSLLLQVTLFVVKEWLLPLLHHW
ncbi:hypothetical protein ABIB60_000140 [Hymenobacter sp. UYP22]